jgi:hypothetical protein
MFSDDTIVVYQAYGSPIADAALAAGTFVAPFRRERMTWIKPSFLWMMYRSGWATKEGQERVLAITLTRAGFEWALAHASLSHFDRRVHDSAEAWAAEKRGSPVRVQWDPERSLHLEPLPYRSIQIGLSGQAVTRYASEWIRGIREVTDLAAEVRARVAGRDLDAARALLPDERPYPLPEPIRVRLGASVWPPDREVRHDASPEPRTVRGDSAQTTEHL